MKLTNDAFNRGDLGWPCVWQSFAAARTMVESLNPLSAEFRILELGFLVKRQRVCSVTVHLPPERPNADCSLA